MAPSILSALAAPSDRVMMNKYHRLHPMCSLISVTPSSSFLSSSKNDVVSGSAAREKMISCFHDDEDDVELDILIDDRSYPSGSVSRLPRRKLSPNLISGEGVKSGGGKKKKSAVWDAKEDEEAVHIKMEMPGLGKENVKVSAEGSSLNIKGEAEKEENDSGEAVKSYILNFEFTPDLFKFDQVKAEMKNGVLKVVVPKVKKEERKDIFQVMVE